VYIAGTPLDAGDTSASDDPGPSASLVAEASGAPSPVASLATTEPSVIGTPEPTPTEASDPTPLPTAEPTPYDDPSLATVGSQWTTAPIDGFAGQFVIVSQCLRERPNRLDGLRYSEIGFRVSWEGDVPVDRVDAGLILTGTSYDDRELAADRLFASADSYEVTMTVRPRTLFDIVVEFYEVLDASAEDWADPGRLFAEITGQLSVDPRNPC
jgi:hypothetical protein